jgi:hypothetical protein
MSAGCGSALIENTNFPNRVIGEDGQVFFLEDLREVAEDPDLSAEEKRERFRNDFGIEDEDLIEGLLTL